VGQTLRREAPRESANFPVIAPDAPAHTVFILSPANLGGDRGALILRPDARSPLALRLRADGGAPLRDVFSFISSLYFRGKAAYAQAFGRPPSGLEAALVISPGEGLRPVDEPLTLERARAWAGVPIDERNPDFTTPLIRDAEDLERGYGATTRFVLLGSVASNKYVRPLTRVFGDHLLFPPAFVGRGDMSRGGLLLRAVRAGRELDYAPVEGAVVHGPRVARLERLSRRGG
jgi:hypothetical protein